MTNKGFKIWYTDGTMLKSENWENLPNEHVQSVVLYKNEEFAPGRVYREISEGADWYWFDGEHVKTVASAAEDGWQSKPVGISDSLIKQGEYANSYEDYMRISNEAFNEYVY